MDDYISEEQLVELGYEAVLSEYQDYCRDFDGCEDGLVPWSRVNFFEWLSNTDY